MDNSPAKRLAVAKFMALRNSPLGSWDDNDVSSFHDILSVLQEAFGEDLSAFRIPDERMQPVPAYVQRRPRMGRPVPPIPMTGRRLCSEHFARQQIEGLYSYLQQMIDGE